MLHHESVFGPWISLHLGHPLPFTYPPLAALFAVPVRVDLRPSRIRALEHRVDHRALLRRARVDEPPRPAFRQPALALAIACAIALSLTPVQDEIGFGQVGIVLMAMCFFDCASEQSAVAARRARRYGHRDQTRPRDLHPVPVAERSPPRGRDRDRHVRRTHARGRGRHADRCKVVLDVAGLRQQSASARSATSATNR